MNFVKSKNLLTVLSVFLILAFSVNLFAQKQDCSKKDFPASQIFNAENLLNDVKFFSSDEMKGRETGTPENVRAREYILKRFKESGIKPLEKDYLQKFSFTNSKKKTINGANVVGFVKGMTTPDKYIVVTAHFDHVGVEEGEIYNGADDNASGTAALFAIGEYFSKNKPNHSIIFVALDAEEMDLNGAKYFVDNLPFEKEYILLNINMDMISRNEKSELYVAGTYHYPNLKPYVEAVQSKAPVKLLLGHDRPELESGDWTLQSDHAAFHKKGIPFLYFGVEDHEDYHRPTDDFENIQPKFYVNAVETILMAIKEIDKNYRTSK